MRVISSLADIEFSIGRISRQGSDLVIDSGDDSTIPTKVTIEPRDALRSIAKLLASPSVWLFLVRLPLAALGAGEKGDADGWAARRKRTGLNKPW